MMRVLIESGLPPESIAEKVFEAIQANQFLDSDPSRLRPYY